MDYNKIVIICCRPEALQCGPCDPNRCPAIGECHRGITWDVCNCCEVCAKVRHSSISFFVVQWTSFFLYTKTWRFDLAGFSCSLFDERGSLNPPAIDIKSPWTLCPEGSHEFGSRPPRGWGKYQTPYQSSSVSQGNNVQFIQGNPAREKCIVARLNISQYSGLHFFSNQSFIRKKKDQGPDFI